MDFVEFLDNRFLDSKEIEQINRNGISSGFKGFREYHELEYLYNRYENDIDKLIIETGHNANELIDRLDNERTTKMKKVWLAVSIYCLSRVDSYNCGDY